MLLKEPMLGLITLDRYSIDFMVIGVVELKKKEKFKDIILKFYNHFLTLALLKNRNLVMFFCLCLFLIQKSEKLKQRLSKN